MIGARSSWAIVAFVLVAAWPVAGQEARGPDVAFDTLCAVEWSIGPIWAGATLGCPPVVQPLSAPNRPCRRRYTNSQGTAEEARLRYDAAGRLSQVETVSHGTADYVYDATGRLTTHRRRPMGYPATTTSFVYTPGASADAYAIASQSSSSEERNRWDVDAGQIRASEYVMGAVRSTSRWIYENRSFVAVETIVCRDPSGDPSCDPSGPSTRATVVRDRAGRIRGWDERGVQQRLHL